MASVILRSAGAAVGNMLMPGIGGALLGGLAGNLGNVVDGQLGLGTTVTGPRLENLSVQDSRYGAGIPIVYGNARIAGNVIWSTNLIETQHNSTVGGKGGATTGVSETTYTYSVHCAVGICAVPIAGINTIWADSTVIYQDGVWTAGIFDGVSIYTGAPGQAPDSFMQSILGTGQVPAYNGLAYIVFDNLQLANFGGRLPNLTFEIASTTVTNDPVWLGSVDAGISQRGQSVSNGTMLPIVLQSNGSEVQTVLVGGYSLSGSAATFTVAAYDVTQDTPVQLTQINSASFATSAPPVDCSWALSPDGRFVALYLQNTLTLSHSFAIYDTVAQSFGPITSLALSVSSSACKKVAWLDAQHFVIDDSSGTVRGLHVLARAGLGVIDLGFTPLWGAGSSTTTQPLDGAQFTPFADGLLAYNFMTSTSILQARTLAWRSNQLSLGTTFIVAYLALGTGSNMCASFTQTASGEWTLFYSTVLYYSLMSFEPSASGVTITRPWQTITPGFGIGTVNFPVFYGDRFLVVQNPSDGNNYLLSEVALASGSFTLTVNAASVTGGLSEENSFAAIRLDSARILFMGVGGSVYDIGQLAIIERNAQGSVAAIMTDILTRAGYAMGDYDVSALTNHTIQGYVLQEPMSARNAIEPLQSYAPFDLIETTGQLAAVLRGGAAAATVPSGEWRAAAENKTQPPPLLVTRAQEMDLPREVDIDVIDPSRNFEVNCQRARRIATSARAVQKISLPIVCDVDTAKQIAETKLYTAWAERDLVKISVSRTWLALDPSDVIDLNNGNLLRIASINQSGGLLQLEGFYSYAASLSSAASADGGQNIAASGNASVGSVLYLMDIPLLQSTDDQPGVYVAVTGLSGWTGASVLRSSDGINYTSIESLSIAATAGIATTVLPNASALYMDNVSTVNVQVTQGTLASCTWIDMTNGTNAALLGSEIIQFQTATLIGPGFYTLSNLLRGRRGTEYATSIHVIGENFVLLQAGAVDFIPDILSDRNKTYDFRALSSGQSLSAVQDYVFTYGMKTICPFAPVNIKGSRSLGISGDLTLTWTRRARLNAEWVDYIDVPLDEPQELYECDIINGTTIIRAFTGLTSPTALYTAAQQTTDWGSSIPSKFTVNIYQTSSRYGNGNAVTALI
jgi:hypothetical protein